jgi:hypothetical protein
MAHFAELDENNVVLRVIVVADEDCVDENGNESEEAGSQFCADLLGGRWVQTSYNANFRKNYAGTGFIFDEARNAFIEPDPGPNYEFNEETCRWVRKQTEATP